MHEFINPCNLQQLILQETKQYLPLHHQLPEASLHLLKPTSHVMQQQFHIQQLYVLPTLHFCILYLSENKQRLVPLIS